MTYSHVQHRNANLPLQARVQRRPQMMRKLNGRRWKPLHRIALLSAVGMVFSTSVTHAQGISASTPSRQSDTLRLSVRDARAMAVRANPELQASRFDIAIARGDLRQAGVRLRANPEADVITRGAGAELGIAQELEIGGQRGARQRAARAGLDRATAAVSNMARTTIGDVDRAYYRFVVADRRHTLAREILDLNQRLAEMSQSKIEAGQISMLEHNLSTVEFGRSRARALAASREREEMASELRRLLGLRPGTVILPTIDSTPRVRVQADSLSLIAQSRRPDLIERAAAVREATAQISVARREALPNLVLRATSEPLESSGGRQLRPGIGFTIPAFNRNKGEVQAREAAARQAELEASNLTARIQTEIARAVASYESAAAETAVLESTVLAPARENRALLETAYREGKVGLPVLLLIRNQVIDAELEYWDAWLAERIALADLVEATGEAVVGFDPQPPQ